MGHGRRPVLRRPAKIERQAVRAGQQPADQQGLPRPGGGDWSRCRTSAAAGFGSWLRSQAYSPSEAAGRLCQLDPVSRWLEREGLGAGELTAGQAGRFAAARRAAGRVTWASPQSVALPLGYLRELGVAPVPAPPVAQSPLEELLADYRRYLRVERGLSDHTMLDVYGPAARCSWPGGRARAGWAWSGCARRTWARSWRW